MVEKFYQFFYEMESASIAANVPENILDMNRSEKGRFPLPTLKKDDDEAEILGR